MQRRSEEPVNELRDSDPVADWSTKVTAGQMFQLIDKLLPFEACLYHQIIPISVEGSRINLGMVNPKDADALSYVRQILAYLNCSLVPRKISPQAHNVALSAYLRYVGKRDSEQAIAEPQNEPTSLSNAGASAFTDHSYVTVTAGEETKLDAMALGETSVLPSAAVESESARQVEQHDTVSEAFQVPLPSLDRTALVRDVNPLAKPLPPPTLPPPTVLSPGGTTAVEAKKPLTLEINAVHVSSPIKVLAMLPPYNLVQELLARVLSGGIGRLFFERRPSHGRVIWSQNGIIKAELEDLSLSSLQESINELKRLHNLPLEPVQTTVRVEIERFYQQARLLLRLQVMPGIYGEEATLQVLRGAALQFYQQQQLATLSRDALHISQQLQQKLNEIHDHALANMIPEGVHLEMLSTLNHVMTSMSQQLQNLDVFRE